MQWWMDSLLALGPRKSGCARLEALAVWWVWDIAVNHEGRGTGHGGNEA